MRTSSTIEPDIALSNHQKSHDFGGAAHLLTVNVEDYYQAAVFHRFIQARNWYRFDSRLQQNVEATLKVLDASSARATFFVLGWIAEKHPELVRRISESGHEVASRGYLHQPLLKLTKKDRLDDLIKSRTLLEDIVGKPVHGFRLSDGWLRHADLRFLEEVREAGYLYDSSLMPLRRDFRHQPSRRTVHQHQVPNGEILEIPPSTIPFAGGWIPIAGGNYQRQLPDSLMRSAVHRWTQTETAPYVMYFQVWEMDSEQPEMSAVGRLSRIRHYRNLGKYRWLLPEYLKTWNFTSVCEHAQRTDSPLHSLLTMKPQTANDEFHSGSEPFGIHGADPSACESTERDSSFSPVTSSTITSNTSERQRLSAGNLQQGMIKLHQRTAQATPVTLVIPCYNEESTLPYLARTLEHLKNSLSPAYDVNVIFVDDCSRDNTRSVLAALFGNEAEIRILHHKKNMGVSAAILTGISAAETEIVCSIDCDCSYDPHELQHMLPLMKPGVAMVTASPYHRDGKVRNVPAWRLTLSHGLSVMYRMLLRKKLSTWTSCFRIYRKSQVLDLPLRESGFLGTAELAAQLSLHDRKIVEHPAVLEVRLFGASKMKTVRTILSHLRLLSRIAGKRLRLCTGIEEYR